MFFLSHVLFSTSTTTTVVAGWIFMYIHTQSHTCTQVDFSFGCPNAVAIAAECRKSTIFCLNTQYHYICLFNLLCVHVVHTSCCCCCDCLIYFPLHYKKRMYVSIIYATYAQTDETRINTRNANPISTFPEIFCIWYGVGGPLDII